MVNPQNEAWWGVKRRKWQLMVEQLVSTELPCVLYREEDMAAVERILVMQEGLRALHQFPDTIYMLQYEALIACPK